MYENQIPPIDYVLITILSSVLAYSTYNQESDVNEEEKEEPSLLSNLTGSTDEKPIESSIEKTDNKIFGGKTHRRKKQTKKNVHKLK
jgi:hypothetical protein